MHVSFLDDCCQCPLSLPSGLQKRGEVARVPDPQDRKLNTPNPCGPGPLAIAIALTYAPRAALVARGAYVLCSTSNSMSIWESTRTPSFRNSTSPSICALRSNS
jgi:hypothetical protein